MSRVFEALQRLQQQDSGDDAARDPLAAETGTPESVVENGADTESHFELPAVIGAPIGPRSNEGALFTAPKSSAFSETPNGNRTANGDAVASPASQPQLKTNGKSAVDYRRQTIADKNSVAEKLKTSPPVIHRTEPETPEAKTPESEMPEANSDESIAIRNQKRRQREVRVEPIVQSRLHPRLILLTDPQAPECEQFRTLRTQLFHINEKKSAQVIIITSTLAGEGKTSTVINLALSIAQSKEKRVLIIDGDLRRSNVSAYLGVRPKTGLGEALAGDAEPLDSLFTLEGYELYVLPVTREAANPTELLSSERFAEMIQEMRLYFDFILIDSPPIMPFADARLLANHADAVMMVVRSGMANYETVEKAIEALPAAKMLGVVLNGAENMEEAGYYDYYYHYAHREERRRSIWSKILRPIRNTSLGRKLKL